MSKMDWLKQKRETTQQKIVKTKTQVVRNQSTLDTKKLITVQGRKSIFSPYIQDQDGTFFAAGNKKVLISNVNGFLHWRLTVTGELRLNLHTKIRPLPVAKTIQIDTPLEDFDI